MRLGWGMVWPRYRRRALPHPLSSELAETTRMWRRMRGKLMPALVCLLVVAGVTATALNVYGLNVGMGQHIQAKRWTPPAGQERLLKGSLLQRRGEPDGAYFRRLTLSVHYRMKYTAQEYTVPASENWILHAGSYFIPT